MRATMSRLTARCSTNRVVREYTDTDYVPARRDVSGATGGQGRPRHDADVSLVMDVSAHRFRRAVRFP